MKNLAPVVILLFGMMVLTAQSDPPSQYESSQYVSKHVAANTVASNTLAAEEPTGKVGIDVSMLEIGKSYELKITADGATIVPLTWIVPTIGTDPPPASGLKGVIQTATKEVPNIGSTENKTIAAGLVIGCDRISENLKSGLWDKGEAADEWRNLTEGTEEDPGLLRGRSDWSAWLEVANSELNDMQNNDELETEEQWSEAFHDISHGIEEGTPQSAGLIDLIKKFRELLEALGIDGISGLVDFIIDLINKLPAEEAVSP